MSESADLIQRMGFGSPKPAPGPAPAATLSEYIADLFVRRLTDVELGDRRKAGAYRNIRPAYLAGYHKMARGN